MMYGRYMETNLGYNWLHFGLNMLIVIAIILIILIVVKKIMEYIEESKPDPAIELLKMRFAKGEINEKEYLDKLEVLK